MPGTYPNLVIDLPGHLSDAGRRQPLLLVVDDQPINVQMLYELFKSDCEVCVATNGLDALRICQSRPPDLVLLDVVMPGIGGYEVCERLKADPDTAHIPVIFVSVQDDPGDEATAFLRGGVDFIAKPYNAGVVRARVSTHLTLKYQSDLLRSLALTDGLTGVANRRHFDAMLDAEWRRCARGHEPLALILADVDYFKAYNDKYGHQSGDACLLAIARALKACLTRSHDLVARYGGEEFACILPDTPFAGAELKARQLEQAVRALAIEHAGSEIAPVVTISLGVALAYPTRQVAPAELFACADQQLYVAKHNGRAQVSVRWLDHSEDPSI